MDGLHVLLLFFSGIVSCSHHLISGSVLEVTARPEDNITVYCDCKISKGVYIVWFRNCSHENQPTLVLETLADQLKDGANSKIPRFAFERNFSSDSYDLLIKNITHADEGLYYCGTMQLKVDNKGVITAEYTYRYNNMTTRITVNSTEPFDYNANEPHQHETPKLCHVCWTLLFSLSPAFVVLSSLLFYRPWQTTAKRPQDDEKSSDTEGQMRRIVDEDVYCAALEIYQATQQPKKKTKWSSELSICTYSVVTTSRGQRA
ncbi:uncharacterized protein LOC103353180 isoform X1 [Stegastes partitus]|uniref:Uncharacterized protein LOC103353180 isoform X1 n=1 Tax=Stegastes partitus TaxID=144197 RepID=A0A9Y4JFD1_9TELE|nr:PREDICTED: uncharacterized protein LOC103353180 isoform X1 [Stegastes partitus]